MASLLELLFYLLVNDDANAEESLLKNDIFFGTTSPTQKEDRVDFPNAGNKE
jgi:hypothetical protein